MLRKLPILLLIVFLLLATLPTRLASSPAADVLRLHILANSDSAADQAVKLRVRDALVPLFEAAETYEDARTFVLSHGAALLDRCQQTLAAAGAPYGAQLLLGVSTFPDRTYEGARFPAGDYDALEIVLGDGAGHNWWCVLFPPLCIVTRDGSSLNETFRDGTSRDGALPDGASPDAAPVTFESDILAFLRDLFGWE